MAIGYWMVLTLVILPPEITTLHLHVPVRFA